jgi:hypothetical protein
MPNGSHDSVAPWISIITRQADKHLAKLAAASQEDHTIFDDPERLDDFENDIIHILDHPLPAPRTTGGLIYSRLYSDFRASNSAAPRHPPSTSGVSRTSPRPGIRGHAHSVLRTFRRRPAARTWTRRTPKTPQGAVGRDEPAYLALMAALYAAEVEHRGPLRLSQIQTKELASEFETLGNALLRQRLPRHAALAFDHAGFQYLQIGEHDARDRCLYSRARTLGRIRPRGWRKAVDTIAWITAGYGLRPYRLLSWIGVQLVVFGTILSAISRDPVITIIYMTLVNYLNMLGIGDTNTLSHSAWLILAAEGYTGAVTSSVFFALLVRRWFRI